MLTPCCTCVLCLVLRLALLCCHTYVLADTTHLRLCGMAASAHSCTRPTWSPPSLALSHSKVTTNVVHEQWKHFHACGADCDTLHFHPCLSPANTSSCHPHTCAHCSPVQSPPATSALMQLMQTAETFSAHTCTVHAEHSSML